MKALVFLALVAIAVCQSDSNTSDQSDQDDSDTPNILLGNWECNVSNVTSSSPCCLPGGTLTFSNSGDNSVIFYATAWAGGACDSRSIYYTEVIDGVDASDSWNQIAALSEGDQFVWNNSQGYITALELMFVEGIDILGLNVNNNFACGAIYLKSSPTPPTPGPIPQLASLLSVTGAGLITVVSILLI